MLGATARECDRDGNKDRDRMSMCVYVCVCVCVIERDVFANYCSVMTVAKERHRGGVQ